VHRRLFRTAPGAGFCNAGRMIAFGGHFKSWNAASSVTSPIRTIYFDSRAAFGSTAFTAQVR
jgi:hypothetical protein